MKSTGCEKGTAALQHRSQTETESDVEDRTTWYRCPWFSLPSFLLSYAALALLVCRLSSVVLSPGAKRQQPPGDQEIVAQKKMAARVGLRETEGWVCTTVQLQYGRTRLQR